MLVIYVLQLYRIWIALLSSTPQAKVNFAMITAGVSFDHMTSYYIYTQYMLRHVSIVRCHSKYYYIVHAFAFILIDVIVDK